MCVGVPLFKLSVRLKSAVPEGTATLVSQSLGWSLVSHGLTSGPSAIMMTDVSKTGFRSVSEPVCVRSEQPLPDIYFGSSHHESVWKHTESNVFSAFCVIWAVVDVASVFSSFNSLQLESCFVSSVWLYMSMKRYCPSLNITTLWTAILCASTESLFFSRFIVTVPLSPDKIGCSSFNAQWQSWSTFAKCIEKWEAFIPVWDLCNHSDIIHYLVLWPQLH